GIGDIELTHALPGVVERDPNRRALTLGDLDARDIRHKHGLASHWYSLLGEPDSARLPYRKARNKSRCLARALDSPRAQQTDKRTLFRIETDVTCFDDP